MNLPVPNPSLDRAALERVLARAAELQGQQSDESSGALTDDQILDLGKEVGLTPEAMKQAIAEERGRITVPDASGIEGALLGPAAISAARVVPMPASAALAAINAVLSGDLSFDVARRFPNRMQWTPRRGFFDTMNIQFARGTEGFNLRMGEEIAATVTPVDAQRAHVRLDAIFAEMRTRTRSLVVTTSAGSAVFWGIAGAAGASLLVVIPGAVLVAAAVAAAARDRYRRKVVQLGTGLEQLLDRLEFGPVKKKEGLVSKLLR